MTNDLTRSMLPGIVEDNEGADVVDGYIALISTERGSDALPRLPTEPEHKQIARRLERLTSRLRPVSMTVAQQDAVMQLIGQLFERYPAMRNADVASMSCAYLEDLGRLPLFAIRGAIDDVKFGRIKGLDPDWPPTSPRLYAAGERHLEPVAVERNKAARVLAVRSIEVPVSEEMRQRVGKTFTELAEATKVRLEDEHQERRSYHAKQRIGPFGRELLLREYSSLGVEPVTAGKSAMLVSPSLAKQLGVLPTPPITPDDERYR